ncbi:MAG: hypothetical protein QOE70_54 [Chthoniobacter sp.]|jgi:hypothetical protein|nr:hypothetical protein [Chthoniobacter sp.]
MQIRSEAEENLRVIRSLMEKATIYRAVSAPAALLGGAFSLVVAIAGLFWLSNPGPPIPQDELFFSVPWAMVITPITASAEFRFALSWAAVLLVTTAANFWLLWRDAARRSEPFVSPGMRLALRAMLPALFGGGLCILIAGEGGWALTATLWVLLYGISLLAASHFAPKSICWLGRAFFVAGAGLLISNALSHWLGGPNQVAVAHAIMGATFGLFHLVYAACAWPRPPGETTVGGEP